MSSYVDANLYHDLVSGRSVTGILHKLNQTPIDWYSKLQATVETATFGSEFVATRTCTEQIIDLRLTLRYLGVPVKGSSMMFGDNKAVVDSSSTPHYNLRKRHNMLSYHRTQEAIAAGITGYYHVRGDMNPADILSKHWDMPSVWDSLKPLMFWYGDTAALIKPFEDEAVQDQPGDSSPNNLLIEGSDKGTILPVVPGEEQTDTDAVQTDNSGEETVPRVQVVTEFDRAKRT